MSAAPADLARARIESRDFNSHALSSQDSSRDSSQDIDAPSAPHAPQAPSALLTVEAPRVEDGAALWRIARDSEVLDLNSSYSYLLWCRDFAATSVVARDEHGAPVAFVTGYVRPDRPQTLVVWQVAVDGAYRGRGLAAALLDALTERVAAEQGLVAVETTVTPDNTASNRLFTSYAQRHDVGLEREVLFAGELFPEDSHLPEVLYSIGPFGS